MDNRYLKTGFWMLCFVVGTTLLSDSADLDKGLSVGNKMSSPLKEQQVSSDEVTLTTASSSSDDRIHGNSAQSSAHNTDEELDGVLERHPSTDSEDPEADAEHDRQVTFAVDHFLDRYSLETLKTASEETLRAILNEFFDNEPSAAVIQLYYRAQDRLGENNFEEYDILTRLAAVGRHSEAETDYGHSLEQEEKIAEAITYYDDAAKGGYMEDIQFSNWRAKEALERLARRGNLTAQKALQEIEVLEKAAPEK